MAESRWFHHAMDIGVFEFRRSIRSLRRNPARLVLTVGPLLVATLIETVVIVLLADEIRTAGAVAVPDEARGLVALFWLFGVYMIAQRVGTTNTRIDAESLLLTTVSARTVAIGLAIAEVLRVLAQVSVTIGILTVASAVLFSSPVILFVVPAATVCFAVTVVLAGSVVGYTAVWLVATIPFVARHKMVLGTIASLLAMGGYLLVLYPDLGGVDQAALAWLPIGWLADLAAIGTPFVGSALRVTGAVVVGAVLVVVGGSLVDRLTTALWFTEPVTPESSTSGVSNRTASGGSVQAGRVDSLAAAVSPAVVPRLCSTPVRRVAQWTLLRTRRDPNRLMYLFIPVFAIGSTLVSTAVQTGSIGTLALPLVVVSLPWLVGSLFAMNPFGDEGPVLPVTLTAVSGTRFVRGLTVPGLLYGLPAVLLATVIASLVSPYSFGDRLTLIALGGFLTCVSVVITPAIGMAIPRFSAIRASQSRDVIPPRMAALAVHGALTIVPGSFLVAIAVAPGIALSILAGLVGHLPSILLSLVASSDGPVATIGSQFGAVGDAIATVPIGPFRVVGGVSLLLGGLVVAWACYRNAVDQFDRYVPP